MSGPWDGRRHGRSSGPWESRSKPLRHERHVLTVRWGAANTVYTQEAADGFVGRSMNYLQRQVGVIKSAEAQPDGTIAMAVDITDDEAWEMLSGPNPYALVVGR